ncbi:SEC14-like protein 4 [Folsomia candida]|uniref:SEC14-like protein 4 n=1 Tax=Folsomia candida TaxID=158441 RepID=UPI000B8F782D|nr:SEC14-like protein 4 [Folsomia candida]
MVPSFRGILAVILYLSLCVFESGCISVWKDITLSQDEKHALDKFKTVMNGSLPHDYMEKDVFLIKWLRAKNLNIRGAEKMLRQHLAFRKEYRMDTIADEDFGNLVYEYAYSTDGVDYEGRPVLALNAADWDIRRGILSGQKDHIIRWSLRAYEIGNRRVRELQNSGQNVTQFVMVCNFDGFNIIQHACLQCIDVIVNFLVTYENNFPGMADSIIAIKTPQTFDLVLRALTSVMSKETREAVKIWGPNRDEWQTNLLKQIPADQLDEEFGGTRNTL